MKQYTKDKASKCITDDLRHTCTYKKRKKFQKTAQHKTSMEKDC